MITPPYLKKGDRIGIVATARKVSPAEMESAISILRQWGLQAVLSNNLYSECNQFSGTDEQRTADLQAMLDDDSIRAVISARGGYGTLRIIDQLNFERFKQQPKWIIGYSDITVLHSHVHNFGIAALHATMPINFGKDKDATESLRKALFGEQLSYEFHSHPLNRKGSGEGVLAGGNLSLLYALSASKSDINTAGKILFIEDLDEYLYHIDRMMLNLKRSGKLEKLAGLVVGGMTDMKDNATPFGKTAEEIIIDSVKEYNFPVAFNFPAGHIPANFALIMGKKVKFSVAEKSGLQFI